MIKSKKLIKKFILLLLVFTFLSASFVFGYLLGRKSVFCPVCPPQDIDFSLFWEAYQELKENFIYQERLEKTKILYGAISGMVKALGDPYTIFLTPEETKMFEEDISGEFEGVGMEIAIRDNRLKIIAPLEGTPAQKAGLRSGDEIVEIDGVSTIDMSLEEAARRIRGPKGTTVKLMIIREGWEKPKEFEIKRAVIKVPSLKWELKDNNIAYLKIYHFGEKTSYEFAQAGIEIMTSPAKKIILDLRDNPGGYLEIARNVASWFLKPGSVILIEDFGNEKREEKSSGPSFFADWPIVVLINQGTASGSEILAAALRENRNILLIGETSFGKGSVQQMSNLHDGSSLKITTGLWLTPKGETISEKGLDPDIKVEMTEEDYNQGRDPQLEKAIEIIKQID